MKHFSGVQCCTQIQGGKERTPYRVSDGGDSFSSDIGISFLLPGSTRRWHGLYRCMLESE